MSPTCKHGEVGCGEFFRLRPVRQRKAREGVSDSLDTLSDQALEQQFFITIARSASMWRGTRFCSDATAMATWLTMWRLEVAPMRSITILQANNCDQKWMVELQEDTSDANILEILESAFDKSLPRAAVIALLRAARASKEQP